ncbi:MAG: hypothetical protein ACYTXI_37610 [Nostoc sp.]
METIKINNSVFLIPPSQPKLQANCAKEYGQFLLDCPPKLTILEAQAGGYLKGNKADFAIAISRPDRAMMRLWRTYETTNRFYSYCSITSIYCGFC